LIDARFAGYDLPFGDAAIAEINTWMLNPR
jgi:hypothetical protein